METKLEDSALLRVLYVFAFVPSEFVCMGMTLTRIARIVANRERRLFHS